uniref:Tyrosine-protein kinase n=1 Tax=Canis lupus familiaris TaxID=9615 RepID=A0A8C0TTE2_CANLF
LHRRALRGGRCRPCPGTPGRSPRASGSRAPRGVGAGAAGAGPGADAFCPGSWYFSGISRARAQQLLLSPANAPGAFLVRPSESSHGDYSLSGTRRAPGVPRPGCPTAGQARSPHPTCLHPRAACRGGAPWARGPPRPTPAAAHAPSFSARLQASAGRREGWAATRPGWREWAARTRPSPVPTAVRAQAKVRHYRISAAADGLYLQKGRLFPSLEELLAYYAANWKLIRNPLLQPCVAQGAAGGGSGCPPPPQKLPQQDEWERPRSEFALRRKLGEGHFGEVWEGLWLGSTPVAVKVIKSAYMKLADLAKEIQTLKSLRHERLIRLHAVCSAGEPVYIVTELMRKGNLQAFLGGPEGRALGLPVLLSFACQVAEGMSYLEERRIVHRDLAARNVLVGDDLACKVADFGLARLLKEDIYSPSSGCKIPVKWTAPEAANYRIYSPKSDVWSFGVLLYEVFTHGQCPYEGLSNHEALQQVTRGYRLPRPAACPAEVYTLMLECWKGSPARRPAFATLQDRLSAAHGRLRPAHT